MFLLSRPTNVAGAQNGSSVEIRTRCTHVFAAFGTDLYAQSVISNEIFASEISRKLIKSALLVGLVQKTSVFFGTLIIIK